MSLIRSLNSGVSGLRSFQTKMDVIGNNIANVETAGYKSSRVSFAEMMNQRLGRAGGGGGSAPQLNNEVGLGVRISSIDRDFNQGAMQSTGIGTDLAIDGEGFFMVSDGGENLLTRAGNFVFNSDGYLVDQQGRHVQGYHADDSGNIQGGGTTEPLRVDYENVLPPQQTDHVTMAGNLDADTSTSRVIQSQSALTLSGGGFADMNTDLNDLVQVVEDLDDDPTDLAVIEFDVVLNDGSAQTITYNYAAGDTVGDMITSFNNDLDDQEGSMELMDGLLVLRSAQLGDSELQIADAAVTSGSGQLNFPGFQVSQEGETNTQTTSTTVYDDLGRAHSLILDFTQTGQNEWEYNARFMDGQQISSGGMANLEFDETGRLVSGNTLDLAFEPGNGANTANLEIELGDSSHGTTFTQFSGSNSAKVVGQDGYEQGALVDISIDGAGYVEGIYDNGNSRVLSQLSLARVQNENGLEMVGGGLFRATSAAGEVFTDTAGNMSDTDINSASLEGSNVDLAKEFTEMITSQRAYQSNAKVISTSDEMLMEAVNLKR